MGGEKEKGRERRKESLMERERGSSTHREVEVDDLSTLLSLHRRMATNGLRCHDRSRQQLVPRSDYPRLGFHLGRYTFHRLLLFPLRSVYRTITARITWSNTVISFRASARRTALLEAGYIEEIYRGDPLSVYIELYQLNGNVSFFFFLSFFSSVLRVSWC